MNDSFVIHWRESDKRRQHTVHEFTAAEAFAIARAKRKQTSAIHIIHSIDDKTVNRWSVTDRGDLIREKV